INLGKVSGAGLKTHVHIHIVPRWSGDTNFMPILTNTRVISEALDETYKKFKKHKNIYEK
ncbi:MAG: HIT family hydrolase, partial [Candidatus Heimdallarchaeota archaeon]